MVKREKTVPVGFRLPESLVVRIDAFIAETEQPGQVISRSNGIRMLLERGLIDAGFGAEPKKKTR